MPYTPVSFPGFGGGLNLRDQPDGVAQNQAIDLLNVTFTERGTVESRDGYGEFTASELTNRADSLGVYYTTTGVRQLLVGCGTRLEALATDGTVSDSETGLAGGPYSFARIGTPNAERVYAGNGTDTLRKWDGSTWTAPTATVDGVALRAMPKAGALCVDHDSNRLIASGFATTTGGPNAATSSPSHVYWSEPGAPEEWDTSNFVQLRPGDGEKIQAIVAWRGQVFVFKETAFWRFYGESSGAGGSVVFNYTPIEAGVGAVSPRAVCVGRDGVYFMSRQGVYRTTGGEPELLSDLIEPVWLGGESAFYQGGVLNHGAITQCAMAWHDERVYLSFPKGSATTSDRTLVFDPRYRWWSLWDIPAAALTSFRVGNQAELVFAYASGEKHIGRISSTFTTDAPASATNLAPNPSAEVNVTLWRTNGGTVTRSSAWSASGDWSGLFSSTVTGTSYVWVGTGASAEIPVTASTTYYGSVEVNVTDLGSGAIELRVWYYDAAGVLLSEEAIDSVNAVGAIKLDGTFTTPPSANRIEFGLKCPSAASGDVDVYADAWLVTQSSVPVAYFDGDSEGAQWTGTAHASASSLGTLISSRWRSGWFDYGDTRVKTIREAKLWGTGVLDFALSRDFQGSDPATALDFNPVSTDTWGDGTDASDTWGDGSDSADAWGGGQALAPQHARQAIRGTVFSTELSSTEAWSLNRLALHLRGSRHPSVLQTDA